MNYSELKSVIISLAQERNFEESSQLLERIIYSISRNDFMPIITEIGSIPEDIQADSSEEKLYTKAGEIVLAKCFQLLGLSSQIIKTRSNCADVIAKSKHHNYTLVADAKSFRLSRTAKNQKDFKVESMVSWKGENDYAVLACPFFQYPRKASQIYTQALDGNVLLFSWEHLSYLIFQGVSENKETNLSYIWNLSNTLAQFYSRADKKIVFLKQQDELLCNFFNTPKETLINYLYKERDLIVQRGNAEIRYFESRMDEIRSYTREKAISELIRLSKFSEKSNTVATFLEYLEGWNYEL